MDALSMIPACVLIFSGSYYLGKASLMLFIESMEHTRKRPAPQKRELPATEATDSVVN